MNPLAVMGAGGSAMTTRQPWSQLLALLLMLVTIGYLAAASIEDVDAAPHDKITICHATSSESNPFATLTISKNGWDGEGKNDHTHHEGDYEGECIATPAPTPQPPAPTPQPPAPTPQPPAPTPQPPAPTPQPPEPTPQTPEPTPQPPEPTPSPDLRLPYVGPFDLVDAEQPPAAPALQFTG